MTDNTKQHIRNIGMKIKRLVDQIAEKEHEHEIDSCLELSSLCCTLFANSISSFYHVLPGMKRATLISISTAMFIETVNQMFDKIDKEKGHGTTT